MSIESIANTLGGAKRTPEGYLCKCPCHDDKTASLSITQKENGTYIYNCFAGCKWQDIQAELLRIGAIQPRNGVTYNKYDGAKFYIYKDTQGAILCRKVKMPDKKMWFERYESGQYIPGLNGMQVPLYNIQQVQSSSVVYLCEGEKDAETLITRGYCATTNHAGAKSWHKDYTETLRNKTVIIIPDNDDAGRKRIDILTNALRASVNELYIFTPDGVEEHGDITDWIENGNDPARILQVAECVKKSHKVQTSVFTDAIFKELKAPDQILKGLFDRGDKIAIIGPAKTKKSFFSLQLAFSVATGTHFLGIQAPKKRRVLLVQYEIRDYHFLRRVRNMAEGLGITIDDIENRIEFLNAREERPDIEQIQKYLEKNDFDLVIFDPFYKMFEGDESDVETIKSVLSIFDRITKKANCALVYVHHDKKGSTDKTESRDRGAGSGILGRDYDCGLIINEHGDNRDAIVIDIIQRNYQTPFESVTLEWFDSHFRESDLQPIVKKPGRRSTVFDLEAVSASALELLANGAMDCVKFREAIRRKLGASRSQERDIVYKLLQISAIKELPGVPKMGIPKKFVLADTAQIKNNKTSRELF